MGYVAMTTYLQRGDYTLTTKGSSTNQSPPSPSLLEFTYFEYVSFLPFGSTQKNCCELSSVMRLK